MNLQERELLNGFLQQLTGAKAGQKDPDAEALIREAFVRQSDAGYLLVQRAMLLEHALNAAQAQASQLQAELEQGRTGAKTSFLADGNSWGNVPPVTAVSRAPAAAPQGLVMNPSRPTAAPPATGAAPGWGSGILGNVATTAAGVVAGSFLFQGIENLMGHHNQGGAWGGNAAQPTPAAADTVINNYYGASGTDEMDNVTDIADTGGDIDGSGDSV